ncbi:hypothetical protein GCM10009809_02670 [Isoptericola hypogeus]|uniref:LysM domain-containing protein n=1 Tax=Isoptericola hypogeus TaxID=300179 RepID=A0ABN2IQV4_9MICO
MSSTTGRGGRGTARLALVLLTGAATSAALALRAWTLLPTRLEDVRAMPVDRLVEPVVLVVGCLAAAWLALSAAVGLAYVVAGRRGHRWRAGEALLDRAAPALVRRLARSAVGIGVGTGLALSPTAALAADADIPGPETAPASVVLDLGWQPASDARTATGPGVSAPRAAEARSGGAAADDAAQPRQRGAVAAAADDVSDRAARSTSASHVDSTRGTAAPAPPRDASAVRGDDDGTLVVLRGDTLWDIAADSLGGSASDADVLREMTRWHDANRDVVGGDPDLILPGQVLRVPG